MSQNTASPTATGNPSDTADARAGSAIAPHAPSGVDTALPRGTMLGHCELIRELGRGGMGQVYLARDLRLGRRVAIKLLSSKDATVGQRFLAEARATARCKHDNIVDIYEVGEAGGRSYMVLEYIEGTTLRAWLRDRWHVTDPGAGAQPESLAASPVTAAPVSPGLAAELMAPVVKALEHAHAMGLVHRDLKPENIMLASTGSLKVLDFGIAQALSREAVFVTNDARAPAPRQLAIAARQGAVIGTMPNTAPPPWTADRSDAPSDVWAVGVTAGAADIPQADDEHAPAPRQRTVANRQGAIMGTLPYMSPEQWSAGTIDARSDIWAMGIMLWELVTGQHPLEPCSYLQLQTIANVDVPMPALAELHPELEPLATIIDRCLRKRAAERMPSATELLAALEPLLPGRLPAARAGSAGPENPYVGLAAFQEADAARFCGRDQEVVRLVDRLRHHRLLTVAGASGAGKSSFVRAGVIPALKRSGQRWESFIVRPGRHPLAALAEILALVARSISEPQEGVAEADTRDELIAVLRDRPGYLGMVLRAHGSKRKSRILLFIDQFEELYTLGTDAAVRAAFVACLEGVADDVASSLRVILSVRSDFLDRVSEDRAFTSEIIGGMTLLPPMSRAELQKALEEPLLATGHAFESAALVEDMLDSLQATRSPLPLLQFTAARLWETRDQQHKRISRASYDALGGIEGALATHADAVLKALAPADQRLARTVFTSLVSDERTRAIVSLAELRNSGASDDSSWAAVERVVRHLAEARLLLLEIENEQGATVELIHESLIERWPKLVAWLDEDQEAAHFLSRLRGAAREWDRQGRSEDMLWRGQGAAEAQLWQQSDASALADLGAREQEYLRAVVALALRVRRRRQKLAAAAFATLSLVAIVVSLLAVRAERKATEAQASARQARNASRMASARENQAEPGLVLALLRELEPGESLPPRWQELARWAALQPIPRVVLNHPVVVLSAAFSPDGKHIASASLDMTARVWNADGTGPPIILRGHQDVVAQVAFSPDGKRVVTASGDRTARVWNADGTGAAIVLNGHLGPVSSAAFSADGTRIVTASRDKTARVWNADGASTKIVLQGHQNYVYSAAFSPDGQRIVTASADGTVRVWSADGTGTPLVLKGYEGHVYSAAFSPDGRHIVTASADRTVRVWNADGAGSPLVLMGHQAAVRSAVFSPDGQRIVTASVDGTARVWNADGTGTPLVLHGHQNAVRSAVFSPDGKRLATASEDRTVRVWNTDDLGRPLLLRGHQAAIASAAFSPDGKRIATSSWDNTARVWNADGTGTPLVLTGHQASVRSAVFSPDGQRIVTASVDGTARVWNADGTGTALVLTGHQDSVFSAAFRFDGQRIVTASADGTARVWNADGTGTPLVLKGHQAAVMAAAFSPDGQRIVTASADKTARVWNADGVGPPLVLKGHQAAVISAAFSPDGKLIATASIDKTARLWNADGSGTPRVLSGHDAALAALAPGGQGAFSPDGARIVTSSDDKTVRVWQVDGTGEPAVLRIPELEAHSVAFSPDGSQIVTTSHQKINPDTGKLEFWATVWPSFKPFTGPSDPKLWTATHYCPSVELRKDLLGVSEELATRQLAECQARVAAAR